MVGILRNAANDVRGELLEQQRLVGGGGRVGGGEVDRAAVGQPGQRGGVGGIAVGEGVVGGWCRREHPGGPGTSRPGLEPGPNSWFARRVGDS
jgi:hypothetical protein